LNSTLETLPKAIKSDFGDCKSRRAIGFIQFKASASILGFAKLSVSQYYAVAFGNFQLIPLYDFFFPINNPRKLPNKIIKPDFL